MRAVHLYMEADFMHERKGILKLETQDDGFVNAVTQISVTHSHNGNPTHVIDVKLRTTVETVKRLDLYEISISSTQPKVNMA